STPVPSSGCSATSRMAWCESGARATRPKRKWEGAWTRCVNSHAAAAELQVRRRRLLNSAAATAFTQCWQEGLVLRSRMPEHPALVAAFVDCAYLRFHLGGAVGRLAK